MSETREIYITGSPARGIARLLTPDLIDTLEAGRQLDALISEHVMDEPVVWSPAYMESGGRLPDIPLTKRHLDANEQRRRLGQMLWATSGDGDVPDYSTDIAAAWWVVEHLRQYLTEDGEVLVVAHPDKYDCQIERSVAARVIGAYAPTAPLAICRAALKFALAQPPATAPTPDTPPARA